MRLQSLLLALPLLAPSLHAAPLDLPPEVSLTRPESRHPVPPEARDSRSYVGLRWHAEGNQAGSVEYWTTDGNRRSAPARHVAGDYRAEIRDLPEDTEFRYILRPYGTEKESREHRYATLPPRGMVETVTIPELVVVYTPIQYTDAGPENPAPKGRARVSEDDLKLLGSQLEDVRAFYYRHTHAKLNIQWDIATLDRDIRQEIEDKKLDGPSPLFERDVVDALKQKGKRLEDYAGVIFLYGWKDALDPKAAAEIYRGQAFGGLTYGVDGAWKFKDTPYSWIQFSHRADTRWTLTHEFGHQLDSMAFHSGFPSLPYNHPDPSNLGGVYGEHWDVNAYLLSHFPREKWIGLRFGRRAVTTDADDDGFPDDDPSLPMDEKRFGSSPQTADMDGDGLKDLEEYTSILGVSHGLNEEMASRSFFAPDPRKVDSDGDYVNDGADPYPEYSSVMARPKKTPVLDGRLTERGEWSSLGAVYTKELNAAVIALQWDERYLYVAMHAHRPLELALDLDADNDGWFAGRDNYRLTISPPPAGSTEPVVSSVIWDWSVFDHTKEPNPYVSQTKDLVPASDIRAVATPEAGGYTLEMAIPYNYKTVLRLYDGKRLGVRPGVRVPGEKYQYTLFEPHRLMTVELSAAPWNPSPGWSEIVPDAAPERKSP